MEKKEWILGILAISIIIFLLTVIIIEKNNVFLCNTEKKFEKNEFELLSSDIAFEEAEKSNKINKVYTLQYSNLKKEILPIIEKSEGNYSLYFEDLVSGSWIGINERDKYIPASLLKVPVMAAILKKIENHELELNQKITIKEEFKDMRFGELYKSERKEYTIKELLVIMIKDSDNTAMNSLYSLIDQDTVYDAIKGLGLPEDTSKVSTKDYSNILKSLYFSTYLSKSSSQLALSLMSETIFHEQLQGDIPNEVKVAHKIGYFNEKNSKDKYYHDCGIIYLENNHYLLCVMTKNAPEIEATENIQKISKIVYDYKIKSLI